MRLMDARIEAVRKGAAATAAKTTAEAEAVRKGAEATAAVADAKRFTIRATQVLGALSVGFIVWDWIEHEYEPYIYFRVRKNLLASMTAPPIFLVPELVSNPGSIDLQLDRPVLVLGEIGSGKTTAVKQLINSVSHPSSSTTQQKVPALMVSMRAGREDAECGVLDNHRDLCADLLRQIGYPVRRFFGFEVLGAMNGSPYAITLDSSRVQHAFSVLFGVCADLTAAARSGKPAALLVFDSIEDLVRSDRLRDHGGLLLFQHLARLFILNTNDSPNVYIVAAGSSAFLKLAYSRTVADPFKFRWRVQEIYKPTSEAVLAALWVAGHNSSTASEIFSVCGTRLRLLAPFLRPSNASSTHVAGMLQDIDDAADSALRSLIVEAAKHNMSRETVLKALRVIDGPGPAKLRLFDAFPNEMWKAETLSRVLYLNPSEVFMFQNQPMQRAFRRIKK